VDLSTHPLSYTPKHANSNHAALMPLNSIKRRGGRPPGTG